MSKDDIASHESTEVLDDSQRNDEAIGRAFRWSLIAILLVAAVIVGGFAVFNRNDPTPSLPGKPMVLPRNENRATIEIPPITFVDRTIEAGIDFTHFNGAYGEKLLPETMGGGSAFFDFDNDGDQDLLLINSAAWPWHDYKDKRHDSSLVLYENDGNGQFQNVTKDSGLSGNIYGMGVAVGDIDNDGLVDLFVTAVGENKLFRNQGDGRFKDITSSAGVAGNANQWSTSSAFFDYDNDGLLDLFVCNYVQWNRDLDRKLNFQIIGVGRAYGPPMQFEGSFPYLYHNNGDGTFTDVSIEAGIQIKNPDTDAAMGKSLGVTPIDVDRDGWTDLIVANDTVQNFLLHNKHGKTFEEIGALAGIGFDSAGKARGAMGIDSARFRNNQATGVAIGNFSNEMTALYVKTSPADLVFTDDAVVTGVGPPTRLELTFGVVFADVDLDGRLDLIGANGHLEEEINRAQSALHYRQPARLLWNAGINQPDEFVPVGPEQTGPDFAKPIVGRGITYADIDNDGDLDLLFTQIAGPPILLRNDQSSDHHWVRLKLVGDPAEKVNRDGIGTWVEIAIGDQTLWRHVNPTRGYLTQVELVVTFGLGTAQSVDRATIHWPNGTQQILKNIKIDTTTVVQQSAN